MSLPPYQKPHASAAQWIAHLRARGLIVTRPKVAARKIELIGYERLRIYFLSRRQTSIVTRPFVAGTTYQDIIALYECDGRIRNTCFPAVGAFEILLRNAIAELLSGAHGSHPYFDVAAYIDAKRALEALALFNNTYTKSRDPRARHYRDTYSTPMLPPIWTIKEWLTFGATSRLYHMLAGPSRTAIARQFGVRSDQVFSNWLSCLVDLRNACAHHDRLFNRSFQKQPALLVSAGVPTAPVNKLRAVLQCLDFMLAQRGAPGDVTARVGRIIARCPQMQPSEAGY